MYYWLQNDVRPSMAGRLTGTVDCAALHPGSAAQYIPLPSRSPQTRWAGSGTRCDGRPASQIGIFGQDAYCESLANLCELEYDGHDHIASKLSTVINNTNTATFR